MEQPQEVRDVAAGGAEKVPRAGGWFRVFWWGQSVSEFGDRISELALPLIAVAVLHAGARQTALLTALIWLPNTVAPVVGAWLDSRVHKRLLLSRPMCCAPPGAMEFLSGLGVMFFDIGNNSLRAAVTPDSLRSRISGAYSAINYGCRPVGALVGGWLAAGVGMRPTLLTAGICGPLGSLWLLLSPVPGIKVVPESVNKD